ncbi:MAG: flagellar motor stator protein MotA [Thermodesulfobacteriota bacterium]
MLAVLGILVVVGSVVGGYLLERGNLALLIQPAEVAIIFGSAAGSLLLSSRAKIVKFIVRNIKLVFSSSGPNKESYLELLLLLYQIFSKIRKQGLLSIEADVEEPTNSPIFSPYKAIISNAYILNFICDSFRVIVSTNMPPHEMDSLLDIDIESQHHEALIPSMSIARISDALPGLGIVAAVLGVVLTMGKINEPPEVLGHSVGAALVGTFLGVLSCYGFVGPMATKLEHEAKERQTLLNVIKTSLVAFIGDAAPRIAVESGRRAIPTEDRPSFVELEEAIRKWKEKG